MHYFHKGKYIEEVAGGKPDFFSRLLPNVKSKRTLYALVGIHRKEHIVHNRWVGIERVKPECYAIASASHGSFIVNF